MKKIEGNLRVNVDNRRDGSINENKNKLDIGSTYEGGTLKPPLWITMKADDSVDATNNANGTNITFSFDVDSIKDVDGNVIDFSANTGTRPTLELCLREIDYCDADGNTKKILVLASQPYEYS